MSTRRQLTVCLVVVLLCGGVRHVEGAPWRVTQCAHNSYYDGSVAGNSFNVSGSNVVWAGRGNLDAGDTTTDWGIFLYDGTDTTQLTNNTYFDSDAKVNETFLVNLSNVSANATIADGQGVGTIVDDDSQGGTFDSVGVPKTIADPHPKQGPRPASSELIVSSSGVASIGLVDLEISLVHGSMTDLTATLTSPSSPFNPQPLTYEGAQWDLVDPHAFDGQAADGTWVLTFTDSIKNGSTATLQSWSLTVTPATAGADTTAELLAADLYFFDLGRSSNKDTNEAQQKDILDYLLYDV